jgi:hypothetical protein
MDATFAALEVAGRTEEVPIMDGFLPAERRRYLHHDPNGASEGDLGTDRLHKALCDEQIPFAIDLERESLNFGVRYMPAAMPVPKSIAPFATDKAETSWRKWKKEQDDMKEAVAEVLHASTEYDPTSYERTLADRVKTRANEMKVTKPTRQGGAKAAPERD